MPRQEGEARSARLRLMEALLVAQPGRKWRTKEIAETFGISPDSATRDMVLISRQGRVPLISEGEGPTYGWMIAEGMRTNLPPLRLSYAEGAALYAAARLLSQQHDERNDAVRAALLSLIGVLPEPLQPHLEAIVSDLDPGGTTDAGTSRVFTALAEGWLSRRIVRLIYDPPHKRHYECRFSPYLLEPSGIGHTLYFIGRSDPPGALRTYKLERVRDAELTEETFQVPADFHGPELLRRAWGVMYGEGEPVHLKLCFSQFVSKRVRETRWHVTQRLTETAEGLVWEAEIGDVTEIRPWIRGWGADCEVLEPVELRREMMTEARRLARVYGIAYQHEPVDGPDQELLDTLFGER